MALIIKLYVTKNQPNEQNEDKLKSISKQVEIIKTEINGYNLLKDNLHKINNIKEIVPLDSLIEQQVNSDFMKNTNNEILIEMHFRMIRKDLRNYFNSSDTFTKEQITEITEKGQSGTYVLSPNEWNRIRIFYSKTYADQYFARYLQYNSCNKDLTGLMEEYRVARKMDKNGPLGKQILFCMNK